MSRENATLASRLQEISASVYLAETEEEVALTAEEQIEQAEAEVFTQIDTLESAVQAEPLDATWAPQAQAELMNAFTSEEFKGIGLLAADCRSTLYRLEVSLDNTEEAQESLRQLSRLTPWPSEGFFRYEGMDSQEAVVYLAKEGHSLPSNLIEK